MYTVASQPSIAAARATPCAWLPALAATTPLARSSSVSRAILVYAPRILNDPGRCRFSHLRYAGPPTSRLSGRDDSIGVYRTTPRSNSAAASISSTLIRSDTAAVVATSADSVSPDISAIPASCQPVALINVAAQPRTVLINVAAQPRTALIKVAAHPPPALINFECACDRPGFGTAVAGVNTFISASIDDQRGGGRGQAGAGGAGANVSRGRR